MNKLTPLLALTVTSVILAALMLWFISGIRDVTAARMERDMLQECVSPTGHKKVPCPEQE